MKRTLVLGTIVLDGSDDRGGGMTAQQAAAPAARAAGAGAFPPVTPSRR